MSTAEIFKNLFQASNLSDETHRQNAFARFEKLGLPTKSNEAWKYTSLKPLNAIVYRIPKTKTFISGSLPDELTISCMNGFFNLDEIRTTLEKYNIEVAGIENVTNDPTEDSFLALNSAFYQGGLHIRVPPHAEIKNPIVINHVIDDDANFINPRVRLDIGADASLEFVEIFSTKSQGYFLNSSLQVTLETRASLRAFKHYDEGYLSSHVDNMFVEQKDSSSFQFAQYGTGSQLLRQNLVVSVPGKQAFTDLRGIAILENDAKMDNYIRVHHIAPESTSRQAFKSVLRDQSHYVFQGNIRIEKEAQKTDSDQLNRNLMLGQKCRVDTKPQLDVFADDVKATHGAAVGQLNPDEKFYLESRSISPEKALEMLCEGFAVDLIDDLKSQWIKNYLRKVL